MTKSWSCLVKRMVNECWGYQVSKTAFRCYLYSNQLYGSNMAKNPLLFSEIQPLSTVEEMWCCEFAYVPRDMEPDLCPWNKGVYCEGSKEKLKTSWSWWLKLVLQCLASSFCTNINGWNATQKRRSSFSNSDIRGSLLLANVWSSHWLLSQIEYSLCTFLQPLNYIRGRKTRIKRQDATDSRDHTVFPALSSPRINTQYSSFWNMYLYNPDSRVYILDQLKEVLMRNSG